MRRLLPLLVLATCLAGCEPPDRRAAEQNAVSQDGTEPDLPPPAPPAEAATAEGLVADAQTREVEAQAQAAEAQAALAAATAAAEAARATAAGAADPEPSAVVRALLDGWTELNGTCRGGSGDDPATQRACVARDAVSDELEAKGWCYGEPGEFGYEHEWHACRR